MGEVRGEKWVGGEGEVRGEKWVGGEGGEVGGR